MKIHPVNNTIRKNTFPNWERDVNRRDYLIVFPKTAPSWWMRTLTSLCCLQPQAMALVCVWQIHSRRDWLAEKHWVHLSCPHLSKKYNPTSLFPPLRKWQVRRISSAATNGNVSLKEAHIRPLYPFYCFCMYTVYSEYFLLMFLLIFMLKIWF